MTECNGIPSGILAIDTSTEQAGISLSASGKIFSCSWAAHRAQTTTVLPAIDQLVSIAGLKPGDISGVVVAIGPGTFTGLRVGLALAKGIVAASGVPLVSIPTLDIIFASHKHEPILAVLPAGRGRVVWQERDSAPRNSTILELIESLASRPGVIVTGELTPEQAGMLQDAKIQLQNEYRDPAILLHLGAMRLQAGDIDDPISLEPTYLHGLTVPSGPVQDRLRKQP